MNTVALEKLNRKTVQTTPRPIRVLQFGEGNFLRAFVDWMIDIINEKTSFNGMVQIVQPLPTGMGGMLNEQDGLYHVLLNGIQNGSLLKETRLITSVAGVVNPHNDFAGYLKLAENPDLRFIVSNTTEAGIAFSSQDTTPETLPNTFPGKLTALLFHRFRFFKGSPASGLVFLPCELIDKNGEQLKRTVLTYAEHWQLPQDFHVWISESNVFCNTLVDRIVPGFPADTIDEICQETRYDDKLVVKAEPFHLWVIECPPFVKDLFPAHEAGLDVKFVNDLGPYRTRKVRILNGAHTAMVPVAYLRGLRTVQETVEDAEMGDFVRKLIFDEIIPTLDLPQDELQSFAESVLDRFRNPCIRHELASIALNSVSKFKVRVLPSLLEYQRRRGNWPQLLTRSLAALILFYRGTYEGGATPVNDSPEVVDYFRKSWILSSEEAVVQSVLSNAAFWDTDLAANEGLASAVTTEVVNLVNKKSGAL